MIAFGCVVEDRVAVEYYAAPGIERAAEANSEVHLIGARRNRARNWNLLLDLAARNAALEALVLVHPHAQITDPKLCERIRAVLASEPDVAVMGAAGARCPSSPAWWTGTVVSADVRLRYQEHGGGELPRWAPFDPLPAPSDVDVVEGSLLILSAWAVRNLRFDERLPAGHGCDVDLSLQAREHGKRARVIDTSVTFHGGLELVAEDDYAWLQAHELLADKWEGAFGADGPLAPAPDTPKPGEADNDEAWRDRAWRAEAEREAARSAAHTRQLHANAALRPLEAQLQEIERSLSWRLTEPLRRLNHWRRRRRALA